MTSRGTLRPQKTNAEMIAKLRAQAEASRLRRENRLRAMRPDNKMARQLIDAGYKAMALKHHGSKEAMGRLRTIRTQMKKDWK
jgi:hypothetical protein